MKHTTSYTFEMVLRGVYENTPNLDDALYQAGCDDALISFKNGIVCLSFDRKSASLESAIRSAIDEIENSPLPASVDHIEGSFVTLSEIAQKINMTKQVISLYVKGQRGKGKFPVPFSGINSSSPIWRWSEVLQWLFEQDKIHDKNLLENANVIDAINIELQLRIMRNIRSTTGIIRR